MPKLPAISQAARRRIARSAAKAAAEAAAGFLDSIADDLAELLNEGAAEVEKVRQKLPKKRQRLKATRKS